MDRERMDINLAKLRADLSVFEEFKKQLIDERLVPAILNLLGIFFDYFKNIKNNNNNNKEIGSEEGKPK